MATTHTITQTHERKAATGPGKPYLFLAFKCDRPLEGGARFSLEGADVVTVGRGGSLQIERGQEGGATTLKISVPDGRMSALHARLQRVLNSWVLEDLGSKNGTLIDGKRVTSRPLAEWRRCRPPSRRSCSAWWPSPGPRCPCWFAARAGPGRS